jgi:hypothetical protein
MTRKKICKVAMVPVTILGAWLLAAPVVLTQGRFQVESRDVLSQSSLVIYTIRDNQLMTCYTLFIVEPPPAPVVTATEPATSDDGEEARAARDQQLAALKVRVDARTAGDRVMRAIEDEAARQKIEDDFDRAMSGVPEQSIPSWTVPLPGMQTGVRPYEAAANRRAPIDSARDRATVVSSDRLEHWLMQAAQAPRIAATGPVPCQPNVVKSSKP